MSESSRSQVVWNDASQLGPLHAHFAVHRRRDSKVTLSLLSIGAASAQSLRDGDGAVTLTPGQRAVIRDVIRDEGDIEGELRS